MHPGPPQAGSPAPPQRARAVLGWGSDVQAFLQQLEDLRAKKRVEALLECFGYSVIDLGNLRDGGLIQQAGGPLAGRDFLERGES